MLLCQQEQCLCFHHRLLQCIKKGFNDEAKLLLQRIENICDVINDSGETLLHYSVEYANSFMVQHLVEIGCDINAEDNSRVTPLMLAINIENVVIVEILLKNSTDVFVRDFKGENPLESYFYNSLSPVPIIFLRESHQLALEILFERINRDFLTNKDAVLKLLLDVNDVIKLVIVVFGNDELTRFMLENGYEIDFRESRSGLTALHAAMALGRIKKVKSLIQLGASVNVPNKFGGTLIIQYTKHFEWLDENSEVLKTILDRCTTLYVLNGYRITDVKVLLLYGQKDTVRIVLQSGIDIVAGLGNSEPLLHVLIKNPNENVIDVLGELNISFDVSARDSQNRTALFVAASYGFLHKVEFLFTHGAGKNDELDWPLANAVMYSSCSSKDRVKIVEHLLHSGANPQVVFDENRVDDEHTLIDRLLLYRPYYLPSIKIIIAHLAMMDAIDKTTVTEHTRNRIDAYQISKDHFDYCAQQLEELKTIVVDGTVTLFKWLSESEEKLVAYTRNQELIAVFETAITKMPHLESYYVSTLRKRLVKALNKMKVEEKVSTIIGVLLGFGSDAYHVVVHKIINYLDYRDLDNLCKIERK